jgi:large subunit ribosomal protein L12
MSMEYAHTILALAENDRELSEENITAVLEAAGSEVSESRVKAFVAALEGVDIDAINAQALAISSNGSSELALSADDEMLESTTTEAFTRDFSPAEPVDPDEAGHESGAFGLDPYSPQFPEDASEWLDHDDDSDGDAAAVEADDEIDADEDVDVDDATAEIEDADMDDLFAETDDEDSDEEAAGEPEENSTSG